MNHAALVDLCLGLPQAVETFPFGEETSVFKVSGNGRIFALSSLERTPLQVSLKVDPEDSISLRERYAGIIPGYHLNKRHWITVDLESDVPDDLIEELVRGSHALVRPRTPSARGPIVPMVEPSPITSTKESQ